MSVVIAFLGFGLLLCTIMLTPISNARTAPWQAGFAAAAFGCLLLSFHLSGAKP